MHNKTKTLFSGITLEQVNKVLAVNMTSYLDIKAEEITDDTLIVSMPVTDKVRQPYGILHGGASVVLAESVGSVASNLIIDSEKYAGVGLEINANHLRPVKSGLVKAVCQALHIGAKTHVWDVKIYDGREHLVCVCRLTVAVIPKK